MYTHIEKDIYFKELTHEIVKLGKSKICRVSQQATDPGREGVAI